MDITSSNPHHFATHLQAGSLDKWPLPKAAKLLTFEASAVVGSLKKLTVFYGVRVEVRLWFHLGFLWAGSGNVGVRVEGRTAFSWLLRLNVSEFQAATAVSNECGVLDITDFFIFLCVYACRDSRSIFGYRFCESDVDMKPGSF